MIYIAGEEEKAAEKKFRPDVDENTRFYIPEAQLKRANEQYGGNGANVFVMIGGIAALLIIGALITYFTI